LFKNKGIILITNKNANQLAKNRGEIMSKTLILFYSRPGANYVSGNIVNLEKGNCLVVAEKIAATLRQTQGADSVDMFQVKPQKEYSLNYTKCTEEAKAELKADARPAYIGDIDVSPYDNIIVGYPIWWGTFPMPLWTFLENHDFSGKKIIPFSTHEGSGLGHSVKDIQKLCPNANVMAGIAIHGSSAAYCESEIQRIVESI